MINFPQFYTKLIKNVCAQERLEHNSCLKVTVRVKVLGVYYHFQQIFSYTLTTRFNREEWSDSYNELNGDPPPPPPHTRVCVLKT